MVGVLLFQCWDHNSSIWDHVNPKNRRTIGPWLKTPSRFISAGPPTFSPAVARNPRPGGWMPRLQQVSCPRWVATRHGMDWMLPLATWWVFCGTWLFVVCQLYAFFGVTMPSPGTAMGSTWIHFAALDSRPEQSWWHFVCFPSAKAATGSNSGWGGVFQPRRKITWERCFNRIYT